MPIIGRLPTDAEDRHHFRFIVSLDDADRLDLGNTATDGTGRTRPRNQARLVAVDH